MRTPDFWTENDWRARAIRTVLSPIGALYGLSVRVKEKTAHPFRPRAKVICVGNLTAGGSGKTPLAIAIGRILSDHGRRVVFLSRGYGGSNTRPMQVARDTHMAWEVGDEPLMLAAVAPTVVSRDRAKGAALADSLGAEIIVMDDGFQNFTVTKDLSVVVVDGEAGFGNRRLIPAGPLRETVGSGLARADAVVVMNPGAAALPDVACPTLHARLEVANGPKLAGRKVFAFCGIGRPEKFFQTLAEMGARLVATQTYPDHHRYSADEISDLKTRADAQGAHLVTTEKDFVRLEANMREGVLSVPVRAVLDDAVTWASLLGRLA
ncbi:MAG: tetraacyldisaccharide 4'-kinase [Alphaproteobacteria bacterium]